jgi:hypothetical protein
VDDEIRWLQPCTYMYIYDLVLAWVVMDNTLIDEEYFNICFVPLAECDDELCLMGGLHVVVWAWD